MSERAAILDLIRTVRDVVKADEGALAQLKASGIDLEPETTALTTRLREGLAALDAAQADIGMKRGDQLAVLKGCEVHTDTGKWEGMFSYPNCGYHLYASGLATDDGHITTAGRAALFLAGVNPDYTPPKPEAVDEPA